MKQTNLFNGRLTMNVANCTRAFTVLICMIGFFMFGAQTVSAQTMDELGEAKSAEFVESVQTEMNSLEYEIKYPVGSVKTDFNERLIAYYQGVLNAFDDGVDAKDALMDVEGIATSAQYGNSAEVAPNLQGSTKTITKQDREGLQNLVDALNLRDNNDADLQAIFDYWRTLKNR